MIKRIGMPKRKNIAASNSKKRRVPKYEVSYIFSEHLLICFMYPYGNTTISTTMNMIVRNTAYGR